MAGSDANIFENMARSDFSLFRKYVAHGIMSTDMMKHKSLMTDIGMRVQEDDFVPDEGSLG